MEVVTKKCIICGQIKELSAYYKHPRTSDGRLGKCKECSKSQAKDRHHKLMHDENWVESEKARGRDKYSRLGYLERQKEINDSKEWTKGGLYKNLHRNLGLSKDQAVHHWNYNLIDDYFIIPHLDHKFIHRFISFDKQTLCFKTENGVLLNSRESHFEFISELIKNRS